MIIVAIILGLLAIFGVGLIAELYWISKIAIAVVVFTLLARWSYRKFNQPPETK